MKNIHLSVVLLLVMVAVASGLAGCVATQDFVREEVAASATALRGEMKSADDRLAGQIGAVANTAAAGFKKTDSAIAGLKGQVADLSGKVAKVEGDQKDLSGRLEKTQQDVTAVGKKADTAIREAGVAKREAGIAKVQHRFPGGVRAYLITEFSVGKYELSDTQKKYIKTISGDPKNVGFVVKGILGFADHAPFPDKAKSDELNTELATKRAAAVARELITNGWNPAGINFEGEGPSEVLGPRGYNRSVLVVVGPKAQASAAPSAAPASGAGTPPFLPPPPPPPPSR